MEQRIAVKVEFQLEYFLQILLSDLYFDAQNMRELRQSCLQEVMLL